MRTDRWPPWLAAAFGAAAPVGALVSLLPSSDAAARAGAPVAAPMAARRGPAPSGDPEREAAAAPATAERALPYERVAQVMAMAPADDDLHTLVEFVRGDPDPAVREAAVVALANAEDGRAIDARIAASRESSAAETRATVSRPDRPSEAG